MIIKTYMTKTSLAVKDHALEYYKNKSCEDGDVILDLQDIEDCPPAKPHPKITKLLETAKKEGCALLWLI
jgi:hypothetical protein